MIDFFHKGAEMTKRVAGIAKLKGAPKIDPRPPRKISKIGVFKDEDGVVARILLEVADTPSARKQGLMGRDSLPATCGMLFEGLSGGGYFWMKNCLIPIDVAFIDKDGLITKIYEMSVDEEGSAHYDYDDKDVSAIEVNGGFYKKRGIVPGFKVKTSDIGKGKNG